MAENDVEDDDEENIPDDFVNYSSDTSKTAPYYYRIYSPVCKTSN